MEKIEKSTRHSKIIGNYGENLVCNYLSRAHFEAAIVDHTGIDVIAYNPNWKKRIGISVKSRTRYQGTEAGSVFVLNTEKDEDKFLSACESFGCEPWIGVYVETSNRADLYMFSYEHFKKNYFGNPKYSKSKKR